MSIERSHRHLRGSRTTPMGNRHHDKKLRAEVRAAMAATGERYQQALTRLRRERRVAPLPPRDIDLIPIAYFGIPLTLATFEILGDLSCLVVSGSRLPRPFPKSPLFALARRRSMN
jgi:hypothetical protein